MLYVSSSGREYMVTLQSLGPFNDVPPFVIWEDEDDVFIDRNTDIRYSSLQQLASHHGCILGSIVSVDDPVDN